MDEIWKPIEGYPLYEVSSLGRVRSVDRVVFNKGSGRSYPVCGKILRCRPDADGYRLVTIYAGDSVAHMKVHRLVAAAFLGDSQEATVNHKNGIRHDNALGNLEWMTHLENLEHARTVLGTRSGQKNPLVGTHAVTGDKIGFLTVVAAWRAGFNRTRMHLALRDASRVYQGYKWEYA